MVASLKPSASASELSVPDATHPLHRGHIAALDSVRGIAVLTVMLLHFTVLRPDSAAAAVFVDLVGLGWAGVDLFFVLSGFLITGILLDARGGAGYFRNFYVRRALRIFPLYYATLFALFIVWPALHPGSAEPRGPQLWTLAYLNNFLFAFGGWGAVPAHTTHLWSLAIEEQFYLLWPLVVHWVPRRRIAALCGGLIAAAWLFRLGAHWQWPTGLPGYALLPSRVDALAMGGLLAALVREPGWVARLRPAVPRLILAGTLLLFVTELVELRWASGDAMFAPLSLRVQLLGFPAVFLLSGALVLHAVLPTTGRRSTPIYDLTILRRLGKYSYALYVFHVPVRNLALSRAFPDGRFPPILGSTFLAQTLVTIAAISFTYVLALASWYLLERRFLRLKRYFEYSVPGHHALASVPGRTPRVVSPTGEAA